MLLIIPLINDFDLEKRCLLQVVICRYKKGRAIADPAIALKIQFPPDPGGNLRRNERENGADEHC